MKKYILIIFCFLFFTFPLVFAQIPSGYYNTIDGEKGKELQIALNQIIRDHRKVSYPEVWIYYQYTDLKSNGKIWDIYSDNPEGMPNYEYNFKTDQCVSMGGNEGVCYTREHAFCQSWFGGGQAAPYTDIFHLYPVDGLINTIRNNNPYGIVTNPTRTFTNGSKMGLNTYYGSPSIRCYEPIDEYKGDIARTFFYMATRYLFEDENFLIESPMTLKSQLQPWSLKMLLEWHHSDTVSLKEVNRNNAIYALQKNRNPFIDYPELADKIWSADSINPIQITQEFPPEKPKIGWSALTNNRTLKMTFTVPMIEWTLLNPLNYKINSTVSIISLNILRDTLEVHLRGLFSQGVDYNLSIKHVLAKNMAFLSDTVVTFHYSYPVEQKPLLAWTFDYLQGKPNTPKSIYADYHLLDTVSEAVLYCDGRHHSDVWLDAELDAFTGTTLGDPRPTLFAGRAIAFTNTSANGKAIVFKFPTKGYFNLALTMMVRRTATGYNEHKWEWSLDGENYELINNTTTCPTIVGDFESTSLDLCEIDELNNKEGVFLRLTFFGATGTSGNNRLDNITLYGVSILNNATNSLLKKNNNYLIAPNPNQGQFQIINIDNNYSNKTNYEIYNILGEKIKTGHVSTSFVDISEQPNGIYFLKILLEAIKVTKY